MTTKEKIKTYNKLLQKYLDNKEYIKIFRTICDKEEILSGFILKMSKGFLLIQPEYDFILDGYAIIRMDDYDSIRCNKNDKFKKKILKAERILDTTYGIDKNIILRSWTSIIHDLRKYDYHVIIESVNKDYLDFFIGSIKRVTKTSVSIHNYSPTGKLDKKPTTIKLNDIKILWFGDRYSTTFRKYLKESKPKKISAKKVPVVRIDPALNKYDNVVLFPEKLKKANEKLRKTGFPKLPKKK